MATRRPLVQIAGAVAELPAADSVDLGIFGSGAAGLFLATPAVSSGVPSFRSISISDVFSGPQTANYLFAGPVSGAAAAPGFRTMVAADLGMAMTPQFAGIGLGVAGTSLKGINMSATYTDNASFSAVIASDIISIATTSETMYTMGNYFTLRPTVYSGAVNSGYVRGVNATAFRNYTAVTAGNESGTLAELTGMFFSYGHYNTNAAETPQTTVAYGIYLFPYAKTGTIATLYDIYIRGTSTGGTVTTHWGIYQAEANQNYLAGGLTVGGAIIGNSTAQFAGMTLTNLAALTTPAESWVGPSSTTGVYFKGGNVGIGNTAPSNKLTVGPTNGQSTAIISARASGNGLEFGHTNPAGYGSTLGANAGNGQPFIAFSAEAGTTSNTFRTRGLIGTVLSNTSASTGGLTVSNLPTASADNQTPTELFRITSGGSVGIGTTTPHSKLAVVGLPTSTAGLSSGDIWVDTTGGLNILKIV